VSVRPGPQERIHQRYGRRGKYDKGSTGASAASLHPGAVLEDMEIKWLRGEAVEFNQLCALINCQRRVLADIGLERQQRDVTPTLSQYLTVKADKEGEPDNG
jgi:hypothetical protein